MGSTRAVVGRFSSTLAANSAQGVRAVSEVRPGRQGQRAPLDQRALREPMEPMERLVRPDLREPMGRMARLEQPALKVCKATRVQRALRVFKVLLELQALL